MKLDATIAALLIAAAVVALTLWRAHRRADIAFNLLDLLLENGRVSRIACAFMLVLGVTTWTVVHLTIKGALTEGYFSAYGAMWVAPLVARVVFNKPEEGGKDAGQAG